VRTTLAQVQQSRLPAAIGACSGDLPKIAAYVNQAQQQLINAAGETGWFGGWMKVALQISRANPYISLARPFARIINLDVCRTPIRIQNEFYEMLEAGIGLQDFQTCRNWCGTLEGYERGVFPSMVDIAPTNQFLRVYPTDPRDVGLRVLVGPAQDQNGNFIYSQDGNNSVNGFYLPLQAPFTTSAFTVSAFGGIQKDATFGDVLMTSVDATTGVEVPLSRYAPDEINPAYRRYYINKLPCGCFPPSTINSQPSTAGTVTVTAMAKLEFIPANRATDFLIIGNIPALIEECKAIRYADMDTPAAASLEAKSHAKAIKYLNQELNHYLGQMQPAVNFAPWGTAHLERARIGSII
jgi:hypothetical protein